MSVCLTDKELAELTERERPSAQAKVLKALGIPYQARPGSGRLIVYRESLPIGSPGRPRQRTPNFDHIRRRAA